jgi:hypothetical protein
MSSVDGPSGETVGTSGRDGLYLTVSDIDAGRDELMNRGAKVSEVFHSGAPGAQLDPDGATGRVNGPDPDHKSYSSFATFEDPEGNSWLLQEVTDRLPGRLDPGHPAVPQLLRDLRLGLQSTPHANRQHTPTRAADAGQMART